MGKIDKLSILIKMIRIRMVEQYIAKRYPEQKMQCPTHLCLGQEAVPAIFGFFAGEKDIFVGTCRSHGYYLGKGGNLFKLFAELLGSPLGCSKGFGGSMHVIGQDINFWGTSAIVGGGIPIAAGAALSFKYRKLPYVSVAFLGDAAMEEGVVYETVNFSLLHNLPLLFVCENNRLAINTPIELRQCSTKLYNRFSTMGLRCFYVDENNIERLINVAQEMFKFARNGLGPSFIEYTTSRWSVHVGHDFEGPVDFWWQDSSLSEEYSCPICVLINDLVKKKIIDISFLKNIKREISIEIENAYNEAEKITDFPEEDLTKFVYASPLKSTLPLIDEEIRVSQFKCIEPSKLVNPF